MCMLHSMLHHVHSLYVISFLLYVVCFSVMLSFLSSFVCSFMLFMFHVCRCYFLFWMLFFSAYDLFVSICSFPLMSFDRLVILSFLRRSKICDLFVYVLIISWLCFFSYLLFLDILSGSMTVVVALWCSFTSLSNNNIKHVVNHVNKLCVATWY